VKLTYQIATIRFCSNLTDPAGTSVPIAGVLVGQDAGGDRIAAVASLPLDQFDAITRAVLRETPQLVKKYVDEAFADPTRSLKDVLEAVYDSLRNSLHVSDIGREAELEVSDDQLLNEVVGVLLSHINEAGAPTPVVKSPSLPASASRVAERSSGRRPTRPDLLQMWTPKPRASAAAVFAHS
jgi:hypothetical protein